MHIDIIGWIAKSGIFGWFVSVVLVGVAINIASNYGQRNLDQYWKQRPDRTKTKKIRTETELLLKLADVYRDSRTRSIFLTVNCLGVAIGMFVVICLLILLTQFAIGPAPLFIVTENDEFMRQVMVIVLMIATLVAMMGTLNRVYSFRDALSRLNDFAKHEGSYLHLAGNFPDGYTPIFEHLPRGTVFD